MSHCVKANRVDLQPKSKSRLRDTLARFQLVSKRLKIRDHVGIDLGDKPSNHSPEKDATKAGGGFAREIPTAKGDPPRRRVRPGTEDLEFSQRHHGPRVSPCLPEDPVGRNLGSIVCPHD